MTTLLKEILTNKEYANPFNQHFDLSKLISALKSPYSEEDIEMLALVSFFDQTNRKLTSGIFEIFEKLEFSVEQLRSYILTNMNLMTAQKTSKFSKSMPEDVLYLEKLPFLTVTDESSKKIVVTDTITTIGDILEKLIQLTFIWKPRNHSSPTREQNDESDLFYELWTYANTLTNIEQSIYPELIFEDGKYEIQNSEKFIINISPKSKITQALKVVGEIRSDRAALSMTIEALRFADKKTNSISSSGVKSNQIKVRQAKKDLSVAVAKSHADLLCSHPHLLGIRLEKLGNAPIHKIFEVYTHIEAVIKESMEATTKNEFIGNPTNIPINMNLESLISNLEKVSKLNKSTLLKILHAITYKSPNDNLWRKPFLQNGGNIYFGFVNSVSPSYNNLLDTWLHYCNISENLKIEYLKKYIISIIEKEAEPSKKFNLIDLRSEIANKSNFKSSILISKGETYVLIECVAFDFPLTPIESARVMEKLLETCENIKIKEQQLNGINGEVTKLILANYPCYSGMQIGDISVIDILLFESYFVSGSLIRGSVSIDPSGLRQNEGTSIKYYENANEFFENLSKFFKAPLPIYELIDRFDFTIQTVTPSSFYPSFDIEIISHLSAEQITTKTINSLEGMLNVKYYVDEIDTKSETSINAAIRLHLSDIFVQLAYAPKLTFSVREYLKRIFSGFRLLGFSTLVYYLHSRIPFLNGKPLKKTVSFIEVEFSSEEVANLILTGRRTSPSPDMTFAPLEFNPPLTNYQEQQIISFELQMFSELQYSDLSEEQIEHLFSHLILLEQFVNEHNIEIEYYTVASVFIDILNDQGYFQRATDISEIVLAHSLSIKRQSFGWNNMLRSLIVQGKVYDALISSCILITSLESQPVLMEYLCVEIIYNLLRLYRNLNLTDFLEQIFEISVNIPMSSYDRQKVNLAFYYGYLKGPTIETRRISEILSYFTTHILDIQGFGPRSIRPWLHFLYNLHRLVSQNQVYPISQIEDCIEILEALLDPSKIRDDRARIFGDDGRSKDLFVMSLMKSFETREYLSFISEIQRLEVQAITLLTNGIRRKNSDEMLLASFVLNDQTLGFDFYKVADQSVGTFKERYQIVHWRLNNISQYIIDGVQLTKNKSLIWIFEVNNVVHILHLDSEGHFSAQHLNSWDLSKMRGWVNNMRSFYFNSKKDDFNNRKKVYDYDYNEQEDDFNRLHDYFSSFEVALPEGTEELLVVTSLSLSSFPINLLTNRMSFWGKSIPVANVLSFDFARTGSVPQKIRKDYNVSAWIPFDDGEPIISWGYSLLSPILSSIGANVYTSRYPSAKIDSDINIFMAHGVKDQAGFKAIYTNEEQHKFVKTSDALFGTGTIAILFICNSGFSKEDYFTNSAVSLAQEIISLGYSAVVAPFWPFDVTMSPIWLQIFLNRMDEGFTVSEAVWFANSELSIYDTKTSSIFLSPSGCLAMHLFGKPSITVSD